MAFFRTYILPGLIFQSVIVGGGYATGRELIEFFFAAGPIGGILGLLVAAAVFGVVLAAGFEFARTNNAYDYHRFTQALLGRGWVVYELAFVALLLLILSVIASAAGELAAASFGTSPTAGTAALLLLTALLTFYGSEVIKTVLAAWSFLLYGVYIALFALVLLQFGDAIAGTYTSADTGEGWVSSGILYSGYNLAVLPLVLFAAKGHRHRREAVGSGLIAGATAIIPALLFYIALMAQYPEIGSAPVPAAALMATLDMPAFQLLFQIVIFGTFVETGTALLHAVNERLAARAAEAGRELPQIARPIVSVAAIITAMIAGTTFGIIDLIARGYGFLTLVFIGCLVVPLLTFGIWKIWKQPEEQAT